MARRPNLSAVDLKDTGKPAAAKEHARGRKAQTLRLPPEYWRRLRIAAAVLDTSQIAIVQQALDDWFARNPLPSNLGM
jgi:hypothetical protein